MVRLRRQCMIQKVTGPTKKGLGQVQFVLGKFRCKQSMNIKNQWQPGQPCNRPGGDQSLIVMGMDEVNPVLSNDLVKLDRKQGVNEKYLLIAWPGGGLPVRRDWRCTMEFERCFLETLSKVIGNHMNGMAAAR